MRPAGILAAEMKKFAGCTVTLKTADKTAKASAVMQIIADGENEQAALDKAVELFESGFGE